MQAVGAPPNNTDLVLQSLDVRRRDLVARISVGGDAVPVPIDHAGKILVGLETLPFHLCPPALEELPGPCLTAMVPYLPEGIVQQIGCVELFARSDQSFEILARRAFKVVRMGEQSVLLALDEREALAAGPGVFVPAQLIERFS